MHERDEQKIETKQKNYQEQTKKQENVSIQNLSMASEKISKMNILIIEKLSNIVKEYFHSIEKLQSYYQQIETLVAYNKSLIETFGIFQEQEQKLLMRLRKMEEINIEYMKQYCHVKGRQFKPPQMPQYASVFNNFNLQDFYFVCPKLQPPVAHLDYKNELMSIIKNYFLTSQQELSHKLESRINIQTDKLKKAQLAVIYDMVRNYQTNLENYKLQQSKYFDLLQLRSQIRKKLENFYDTQNQQQIKPNYQQEKIFIDKIINLHSKLQQENQETILECLKQQKEQRKQFETKRVKIQYQILQRYKILQNSNNQNKLELNLVKENNKQLQIEVQKLQSYKKRAIECEECLESKTQQITQLKKQLNIVNNNYKEIDNLLKQALSTNVELNLQIQLMSKRKIVKSLETQTDPDFQIQKLQNSLKQSIEKVKMQTQLISRLMNEIKNFENKKATMERLATIVYQSICMCTYLDINHSVKQKLERISQKLQAYLQEYQKEIQWNIKKDAPDFFNDNYSVINNVQGNNSFSLEKVDLQQRMGYSVDDESNFLKNIKNRKAKEDIIMIQGPIRFARRTFVDKSMGINRVMNIEINGAKQLSLDYSDVSQNKDDYNQLYKLYQQSIQCLQMEEKKTKNKQIQYQKYVEIILRKQKEDPQKYSLENQLVYLTKLAIDQKQTIQTQRKQYNEIFKDCQQNFKSNLAEQLKSLKSASLDAKDMNKSWKKVNKSQII